MIGELDQMLSELFAVMYEPVTRCFLSSVVHIQSPIEIQGELTPSSD